MNNPLLIGSQSNQINQMDQMNQMDQLPPDFLMPVPFCKFVCNQLVWAFCECGICLHLCCII